MFIALCVGAYVGIRAYTKPTPPVPFTLTGTVHLNTNSVTTSGLPSGFGCAGTQAYNDIGPSAPVTVADESGHRRARARPAPGRPAQPRPAASAADVPLPVQWIHQQRPAALTSELRRLDPAAVTAGQATYDLRRLKHRGLITRIPATHRYRVTDHGLHTAKFLTTVHDRLLPTGLGRTRQTPTPQANSRQQPPPTAKRSTPSPSQHNSPHERNLDSPNTNLTQNSGSAGFSFARAGAS